ncbi:MAG TPA: PAS domain S-box protein [Gemmatimonadales bacterium]|nr:PAS domain S-box protein [Gemmatimonadales bacterium]
MSATSNTPSPRSAAERALIESERYFRTLMEQSSDIVVLIDVETRLLYASPSIERVLGFTPDEVLGQRMFELLHPDDLELVMNTVRDGIAVPGTVRRLEYRFRHKDGSWRFLEGVGRNLLDDPTIGAIVVNARDVTERKMAEAQQEDLVRQLQAALAEVRSLRGILPICASCKRIRGDGGQWEAVESYVREHTNAEFTHGLCPDCAARDWGAGPGV